MNKENVFEQVKINVIPQEKQYWLVRTDGGKYYHSFRDGGFIAIGWNEITIDDLRDTTQDGRVLKGKIAAMENASEAEDEPDDIDEKTPKEAQSERAKNTGIFNKLMRFKELKKGDMIIIPSVRSEMLSFGIIEDNGIYSDFEGDCPHNKRRKVKWLEHEALYKLDDVFYQVIKSRHAISNLDKYAIDIETVTETLYQKDDYTYFVITVNTEEPINFGTLKLLFEVIDQLSADAVKEYEIGDEDETLLVKISLNSPGKFVIMAKSSIMIALIALTFAACSDPDNQITDSKQSTADSLLTVQKKDREETVSNQVSVNNIIDEFKVPRDKLNSVRKKQK